MKDSKTSLFFFTLLICLPLHAKDGKHITANGELKALLLFIQFDDDSTTSSDAWPYDTLMLPEWCSVFVSPDTNSISDQFNISQYFDEMSFGKFQLTGDVYHEVVSPKHNQDYYKDIGEVNTEILTSLDSLIDYSLYDNWTGTGSERYINKPDGVVDMLFIIYRNFSNRLFYNNGWTGSAYLYLENDIETNDNVVINKGRMNSGLQLRGAKFGFNYTVYTAAHELGHFLFGGGHIEGITRLGLMTGGPVWNASRGMHSWEKEKLGWIKFTIADTTHNRSYALSDYMTTGDALKIPISSNEYYIVENRQKISRHDKAGDKGIYVYHILDRKISKPFITVLCADGNWNFSIDSELKKLKKDKPNPNGKSEMNFYKQVNGTGFSCNSQVYKDNSAWGDDTDAFDTRYNDVLSPVSNPPVSNKSGIPFTIEITDDHDGIVELNILFKNIYSGKPSKPRGLNTATDSLNNIVLNWLPNKEPDLDKYYIYRSDKNENLIIIDSLLAGHPDSSEIWIQPNPIKTSNSFNYAVSAVDHSGQESLKSAECEIQFDISGGIKITNHEYD